MRFERVLTLHKHKRVVIPGQTDHTTTTSQDYAVVAEIDIEHIIEVLAAKAVAGRSGKARMMHGAIKVTIADKA